MRSDIETDLNTITSKIKDNPGDVTDPLSTENSTDFDVIKNTDASDDPSYAVVAGGKVELFKTILDGIKKKLGLKKIKVKDDDSIVDEKESELVKDLSGERESNVLAESDKIRVDVTNLEAKEAEQVIKSIEEKKDIVVTGKPGSGGQPPLFNENVFGPGEGMKYMEATASVMEIKKDIKTMDDWVKKATELGFGKNEIENILAQYKNYEDLPVKIIQATNAFELQMNQITKIAKEYADKDFSTLSKKELTNILQKMDETTNILNVALDYRGLGGKALRASQADGLIMRNSEALTELVNQIDARNLRPEFQDIINAFANTVDNATKTKLIRKLNAFDFSRDAWLTNWINGLLTWTGTWTVNIASTLAHTVWDVGLVRPTAGFVGTVRRGANKVFRGKDVTDGVYMGEATEAIKAWLGSSMDMWKVFWKTFRYGGIDQANAIPEVKRIYKESETYYQTLLSAGKSPNEARRIADKDRDQKVAKAFPNKIRQKGKTELEGDIGRTQNTLYKIPGLNKFYTLENFDVEDYGLSNPLAKGWNYLTGLSMQFGSRVLRSQDEYIKFGAYRAEVRALAFRHSQILKNELIKKGELSSEQIEAAAKELEDDIIANPENYRVINDKAVQKGITLAFQQKLDGLPAVFEKTINKSVALKTVMPFVRTPVNLFSEGLQNSPLAPFSKRFRDEFKKGGASKDVAIAKFSLGMGAFGVLQMLGNQGRFTGAGPNSKNRNRYQAFERSKFQRYSVVFFEGEYDKEDLDFYKERGIPISLGSNGNLYVSYKGFEPLSAILALAADFNEYVLYGNPDNSEIENIAYAMATSTYEYISSSPFLQSFSGFIDTFSTDQNIEVSFKNLIKSVAFKTVDFGIGGLPYPRNFFANMDRYMTETVTDSEGNEQEFYSTKKEFRSGHSSQFFDIDTGIFDAIHYYRSRTPGLSKNLEDRINLWGEADTYVDPQFRNFYLLGLRSSSSTVKKADQIIMVYNAPIQNPLRSISRSGAKVDLNNEQYGRLIFHLNKSIQLDLKDMGIEDDDTKYFFEDAIVALAESQSFQDLDLDSQQESLGILFNKFLDAAEIMVLDDFPDLNTELEKKKLSKIIFLPEIK